MSKLVINTQYKENYSDEPNKPYWKFKGGDTYVVRELSAAAIRTIAEEGIPTLTKLIESANEYSEEYILDWEIVEDDAPECEEWETPWSLNYDREDGWVARKETPNGEYGYMKADIEAKLEIYGMLEGGKRYWYNCYYLVEGEYLTPDDYAAKAA